MVFKIRMNATRRMVVDQVDEMRRVFDHTIKDLDFMQESLLDTGVMANPEEMAIAVRSDITSISSEIEKQLYEKNDVRVEI